MAKTERKTSLGHKILTVIGSVLCVILIPMLIINVTLIIKSYTHPDEVPSVGGTFPLIVLTDSMYPEIESGDLIVCHQVDVNEVKEGDIIAFFDPASNKSSIVSHRVIDVETIDNEITWTTKGDANNAADANQVTAKDLVGVYSFRVKGAGNIALFMQTTTGLVVCVVLPIVAFVLYDLIRRKAYEKAQAKDTEALRKELEELRKQQNKD